jgi:HAD superfamily hydrolase (TIGR01662 family)
MVYSLNSKPRIPYVLFDLGGTLIYFQGNFPQAVSEAVMQATLSLRAAGYHLDEQVFPAAYSALIDSYYEKKNDSFIEYTAEYVMREALSVHGHPEPKEEHMRQALKDMYAVLQAHWHTEPDAVSTLETLVARGYRLGVVSNASDDADVQVLIDYANIRSYFDFILTSAVAGVRKPRQQIFLQALSFWNARPDQAVMVGDTVSADISGANNVGIGSIWITRRGETPENRAALFISTPDATISTLSELPDLLEAWPK